MNPTFFITFGIKYSTECHPAYRIAHPDGYVAVVADNQQVAMQLAHIVYDGHFAEVRPEWDFKTDRYPLGEIRRFHVGTDSLEPSEEPQVVITEDGRLLVRGIPQVFTPGEATKFANLIADQAVQAVSITAEKAAARARLTEAGVKKHDDMF